MAVLTAQQVVGDFDAAGLAVPEPRDNTADDRPLLGLPQLATTDALSVVRFDDPAAQQRYADCSATTSTRVTVDHLLLLSSQRSSRP